MKIIKIDYYPSLLLEPEQKDWISSEARIKQALDEKSCFAYSVIEDEKTIGFAAFRPFEKNTFFLWNFMIDSNYQGQGKGKHFLKLLLSKLQRDYSAQSIVTTYKFGNARARSLYNSLGFRETEVINESGIHEVNMELKL